MIKEIVIPVSDSIILPIPSNYIGKKVEIFAYIQEEVTAPPVKKRRDASEFWGILSPEEGEKFDAYLKEARDSWDRE